MSVTLDKNKKDELLSNLEDMRDKLEDKVYIALKHLVTVNKAIARIRIGDDKNAETQS